MIDVTTVTVQQFQAQFFRDFPYLDTITYSAAKLYNTGAEVYYPTNLLFYTALINGLMNVTPGSDPTKWALFSDSINNYVLDQDISNAFLEAQTVFNTGLYGDDNTTLLAYLYLTAHFLCNDLQAAQSGINSSAAFPVSSRTVGSVSESYDIPKAYSESPILSQYTSSRYGMKYLAMTLPALTGNMNAVIGGANP